MRKRHVARSIATLAIAGCATVAQAAAPPELIPMWNASDESNGENVDHAPWQELLDAYVTEHATGINRFDYAGLKANAEHRNKLSSYLLGLTQLDPRTLARDVQKAYWINLYNALTVFVIVGRYPVESIRDIKSGLITPGPWEMELITIQGEKLTLDNIEHGILRPIWGDPRIHYAVNCASIGCPNLATEVYTAANMDSLLDAGAREYVNHRRGVDVVDEDFMVISSIYDWWILDYGGDDEGVLAHLVKYADDDLAAQLQDFAGAIDYEYDWDLNQP